MKKVLFASLAAILITGCGVNTSGNIDFNHNSLAYKYDPRTELCFAITASRKSGEFDTTGLGLTNVPCTDKVMALVDNI